MKLFICADMEGVTGITHRDQLLDAGADRYRRGQALLTGDVNAVIEGAVAQGVKEVVISEGHAHMRNILLEELHPCARLLRGPAKWENKPLCQILGLDDSFELAFFVGFHSRAGTPGGLLSHTWAGAIVHELRLNGQVVGETAINAAICGDHGVPVALVCGADDLAAEALADLGQVEVAVTKKALGFDIAECWGPKATGPMLQQAAGRAVERYRSGDFAPHRVRRPAQAELTVHRREMADKMRLVPGLERVGERELRARGDTASAALSTLWHGITEAFKEPADWLN